MTSAELIKQRRNEDWRDALRKSIPTKERTSMERTSMRRREEALNVSSLYREDFLGFDSQEALREAQRCLDCPNPGCVAACPAGVQIPSFIKELERGNLQGSWRILRESSTLSGICSRVCPHENQCEGGCIYPTGLKKKAIAIGGLERYVADQEVLHRKEWQSDETPQSKRAGRIALIGAGPASLAAAHDLALLGHEAVIYDSADTAGGVMRTGIPRFRLPFDAIEQEVDRLKRYGVSFKMNCTIGKNIPIEQIRQEYDAVFVGTGACISNVMGIPGEDLPGILLAGDYLTRTNLQAPETADSALADLKAKRVAIIGGGNTAMDAVRTALRLGAEKAMIVYRRSREEMPAANEELEHALHEGAELVALHQVKRYFAGKDGRVCRMELAKMKLTEPDESGRRRPVDTGEVEEMEVDLVVVCVGVSPDPLIPSALPALETKWSAQIVVGASQASSIPMLYAGGDVARGGATVVEAMKDGRRAAAEIHRILSERELN